MNIQPNLFQLPPIKSDVVYTPDKVAKDIVEWLSPKGICLDPCYGDGAFYRNLPEGSDWCEIVKKKIFLIITGKSIGLLAIRPIQFLKNGYNILLNLQTMLLISCQQIKYFRGRLL